MNVKIGLVGWRGMVGSVLLKRMEEEGDFSNQKVHFSFFTTSNVGGDTPEVSGLHHDRKDSSLKDAYDLQSLAGVDILVSCQGSEYTNQVYSKLRESGWQGYWIDAASALRMSPDSCIVLDPINLDVIEKSLDRGGRCFVGGNCTVSLLLMALGGLFKSGIVSWCSTMTYQAASGAGARHMEELVKQNNFLSNNTELSALNLERHIKQGMANPELPMSNFGFPLAYNVLPFIDSEMPNGASREEWKGQVELNKILNTDNPVLVDGVCVRVPVLRCHSQSFLIKLNEEISLSNAIELISSSNEWVKVIPNSKSDSLNFLTPAAISGSLNVAVGRLRLSNFGPEFISGFTVGDQLLWGAAEPLRRMALIIMKRIMH